MYTMPRLLAVMIGAALTSVAGAQSMPYQPPPDASSYQGPAPANAPAYDNTAPALNDPPGRVARLSYLNGEVSFTPAGEENWVQAQVNRPVVTGDKIWTDADGHAELSLGAANVRLDRSSSFDFLNLDDQLAQMELTQGALNLEVRRMHGNETYEVDTPTIAFVASRVGDYRINVDPNRGTMVTVWRGGGDVIGEGGRRLAIEEGQSVSFTDSQLNNPQVTQIGPRRNNPQVTQIEPRSDNPQVVQIDEHNDFDTFINEREQRYTNASHQYVSEDVVGYEDLDQYGTWEAAPQYGHVWYPREVAADWAPYRDGHWAWIDPWGWTWVDNAPWGYAPSHYGRWSYVGSRWGWIPGPVNVAPVYAPAFVAFVGGGGVSVGFSVGGPVGWFALGPSDVYFPGYRCGPDYFARVNYSSAYVSHTVVNNYYGGWSNGSLNYSQMHYANRDAPRAMTAMRGDAFVAGRPVSGAAIAVNRETFANARVAPRANLMPTRESLVAGRTRAPAPPATAINRQVIAANRPAPAAPSFDQRQALLQRNGGQPLTRNQMRTAAAQQPANARVAAANNVRVVGNNNRGNAVPARAAAEASANRGNTAGAAAQANARAAANNGRVDGQSPSRATEMNRSPEHANAQYQRSAGFAHDGVVPGSERATNAQQGRANGAPAQSRDNAQNREARNLPQQNRSEQANRGNSPQNAQRLNSSTFAHGGQNNARGSATATQQREEASARGNAQQREQHAATANAARENAQARSNATAQQNARDQSVRDQSRTQTNANSARAEANARTQANARAEANARASANARAESNARASANARSAESARQSQAAQSRAQEQQRAAAAEQQSRASSQARAQQQQQERAQQENRAVAQQRSQQQQQQRAQQERAQQENRAVAQQRSQQQQPQREAQMQRSQQQQRAQPQVAHSPPQQRSEPVTRSQPQQQAQRAPVQRAEPQPQPQPQVAHGPPPQQQQKAQPQQHQVAKSAPQQRQQAPKKEKDKDGNPSGG